MSGVAPQPEVPGQRWWLVSSGFALAAMVLTALLMWLPDWPGTALFTVGLVAFLVAAFRNPLYWHRRMAGASLGAAVSTGIVPNIKFGAQFGPDSFGYFIAEAGPLVPLGFVLLAGVFGLLAYLQDRPPRAQAAQRETADRTVTTRGDGSHAAGGDQVIQAPGSTYIDKRGAGSAETLERIWDKYAHRSDQLVDAQSQHIAELRTQVTDLRTQLADKERTIDQLRDGLQRAQVSAEGGDAEAAAAVAVARESGDVEKLQAVLIAEADRMGKQALELRDEYVKLCREIAAIAFVRGDIQEARKRLEAILRLLPDDRDAINRLGHVHMLRGELQEAERSYRRVLELSPDDVSWQAIAYGNLGLIYETRGDLDEAERLYRKTVEIDEQLGRLDGMANAYGNLGLIYQTRGDLDEAERLYRKSLVIEEKLGRLEGMANQYGNLGLIYRTRGDLDEAERMHRKALEINEQLGRLEGMASEYGNLGLIYRKRGDLDEAERMHRKALEIEEKLGRLEGVASEYGNLGLIHHTRGDLDEAERMHRKSLEISEKLGCPEGMANQYGNLGLIHAQRSEADRARELWSKARELYNRIGMPHMVEKVQGLIDGLEAEDG